MFSDNGMMQTTRVNEQHWERALPLNGGPLTSALNTGTGNQAEIPQQEHEQGLDALPPWCWRKPKALPQKHKCRVNMLL